MSHLDRVVVLVDMDCFYCQVEEKLNPSLKGKPVAVVQYNAWRGGGIIAVNYEARACGVTRHMRGNEAKQKCPDIVLVRVPTIRGKADLSKYRDAGKTVAQVLQVFTTLIERASVDEAYLDLTDLVKQRISGTSRDIQIGQMRNTHIVGSDVRDFLYNLYSNGLHIESNLRLAYGGIIVEEMRAAVLDQTGYTCSAGIAHNKILAKLACGLHKPNQQTILPQDCIEEFFKDLPVRKIRSLGGKFGNTLAEDLGITNVADLLQFSKKDLARRYDEKAASWLYNIARGINTDPVTTRLVSKSVGCCKNFTGKAALINEASVVHWLNELGLEIGERLEKDLEENNRRARQMVVSFSQEVGNRDVTASRTVPLSSYDAKKIASDAYEVVKKNCLKASGTFCLKFLGISVGKFEDCRTVNAITAFFANTTGSKIENKTDNSAKMEEETCNYSDATADLDENSSEMVFYNETDKTEDKSDHSDDSISGEICNTAVNQHSNDKKSFFLRYFESLKNCEPEKPAPRDFNTSRNLELDEDDNATNSNEESSGIRDQAEKGIKLSDASADFHAIPGTSRDYEDLPEMCNECGKQIPQSEIFSHRDYHFALQIMHEESKPCAKPIVVSKSNKKEPRRPEKRKSAYIEKSILEKFLKSGKRESEASKEKCELCPQCKEWVNVDSFTSHLDYHAAKKLHLEINSPKPWVKEISAQNKVKNFKKDKKCIKNARIQSVASFFKPTN